MHFVLTFLITLFMFQTNIAFFMITLFCSLVVYYVLIDLFKVIFYNNMHEYNW